MIIQFFYFAAIILFFTTLGIEVRRLLTHELFPVELTLWLWVETIAIGVTVWLICLTFFVWGNIFYSWLLLSLIVIVDCIGIFRIIRCRKIIYWKENIKTLLVGLFVLLILSSILVKAYAQPGLWDDLTYHLPIIRQLLKSHGLVLMPFIRYPFFPLGGELLLSTGSLIHLGGAQYISCFFAWLMMLAGVAAIFRFNDSCNFIVSRLGGLFFILFASSNEFIQIFSHLTYIDIPLTCLIFLAILELFSYFTERKRFNFLLSALLLGVALAIKYSAIIMIAPVLVFLLLDWLGYEDCKVKNLGWLLVYGVLIFFMAFSWYLRNIYYTHNPVWPFLSNIFGRAHDLLWNASDYKGQFVDFGLETQFNHIGDYFVFLGKITWSNKHLISSLIIILLAVFFVVQDCLVLIGWVRKGYRKMAAQLFLLFVTIFYFIAWSKSGAAMMRYLLPVFPIFLLQAIFGFCTVAKKCCSKINCCNKLSARLVRVSLVVVVTAISLFSLVSSVKEYHRIDVNLSHQRQIFGLLPLLSEKETTYVFSRDGALLLAYADGQIIGDFFGPGRYSDLNKMCGSGDSQKLAEYFKKFNVNKFIAERDFFAGSCFKWCLVNGGNEFVFDHSHYCVASKV